MKSERYIHRSRRTRLSLTIDQYNTQDISLDYGYQQQKFNYRIFCTSEINVFSLHRIHILFTVSTKLLLLFISFSFQLLIFFYTMFLLLLLGNLCCLTTCISWAKFSRWMGETCCWKIISVEIEIFFCVSTVHAMSAIEVHRFMCLWIKIYRCILN